MGERLLYKNAHLQTLAKRPTKTRWIKGCALELLSRRPIPCEHKFLLGSEPCTRPPERASSPLSKISQILGGRQEAELLGFLFLLIVPERSRPHSFQNANIWI